MQTRESKRGVAVSPGVRDYLGLKALDLVDWRFVEKADVSTLFGMKSLSLIGSYPVTAIGLV